MFWGYTPALDILREYFRWLGKDGDDEPAGSTAAATGILELTEDGGGADPAPSPTLEHVQEDHAADDAGRRGVIGELLLAESSGRDVEPQAEPHGGRRRQYGGGRDATEQRDRPGGQQGPVPLADGADGGGHVHLDGAVHVQPGRAAGLDRDDAVRADGQAGLLPPPAAQDHPRDPDRGEEVTPCRHCACRVGEGCSRSLRDPPRALLRDPLRDPFLDPLGDPLWNPCGEPLRYPARDPARESARDPHGLFHMELKSPGGSEDDDDDDSLCILLVGGLDCRHVLKTLSRLHFHERALGRDAGAGDRSRPRKVRLFVAETVMEVVARQFLFLVAALEPPDRLGSTEKVRLLLELLGNALVRPSTALWLRNASRLLVDLVTDERALRRRLPLVDLSHLRHRDRDRLEEILAFYQERPQAFRVGFHWDQRLRRHLGVRYDTRAGVFDWDYHMALRDLPAGDKVCVHEYRQWRETGVAFTWLEAEQSEPNLTLAAAIVREGCRLLHGGYLGDIVTSPYIAYAVELEPEDAAQVFRKANDQYVTRSTDAAERHLERIVHELQHRERYQPKEAARGVGGVVLTRVTDESRLQAEAPPDEDDPTLRRVRRAADMLSYDALPVDGAQVVFLSPRFLQAPLEGRARYAGHFHAAVLGLGLGERHLDADLVRVLRPGGLVLVEGGRFLLQRPEARDQAAQDLQRRAEDAGLRPLQPFDPAKDDFAKFVVDAG